MSRRSRPAALKLAYRRGSGIERSREKHRPDRNHLVWQQSWRTATVSRPCIIGLPLPAVLPYGNRPGYKQSRRPFIRAFELSSPLPKG